MAVATQCDGAHASLVGPRERLRNGLLIVEIPDLYGPIFTPRSQHLTVGTDRDIGEMAAGYGQQPAAQMIGCGLRSLRRTRAVAEVLQPSRGAGVGVPDAQTVIVGHGQAVSPFGERHADHGSGANRNEVSTESLDECVEQSHIVRLGR